MRPKKLLSREGKIASLVAALGILFLLAGCGGGEKAPPANGQPINVFTEDGITLKGHLFVTEGEEPIGGVVLAHMFPADERSWFEFAEELADKGFVALTFNFRGYEPSEGTRDIDQIDKDVAAALKVLRSEYQGIEMFLVGASMGGTAALKLAAREEVAGVVTFSAPVEFSGLSVGEEIAQITEPKLFLASQEDTPARESAEFLYSQASEPKQSISRLGRLHGTDMLQGDQGEFIKQATLQFLDRYR